MGAVDYDNAPRLQASETALNPAIGDAINVQQALEATGQFQSSGANASSDDPIAIDYNGGSVNVDCQMDAPPPWLNTTSEIIAPGLYQVGIAFEADTGPTTPGGVLTIIGTGDLSPVSCDVIDAAGSFRSRSVISVSSADLPWSVTWTVSAPTDATGDCTATGEIVQLLANTVPA